MSVAQTITEELIRTIDPSKMGDAIRNMGTHFRDARTLSTNALTSIVLPKMSEIRSIVVAGLGGSAIGGDILRSYLLDKLTIPLIINRTYRLPKFVDHTTLVILSSYSGDTEETLAMYEDAMQSGSMVVCITTGGTLLRSAQQDGHPTIILPKGFQPRAALAYSFIPLLTLLEKIGFVQNIETEIRSAADELDVCAQRYSLLNESNQSIRLAASILSKVPVIYSSQDIYDTVNLRWRGQIQENAKHSAFGNILPEMNHNEINGWDHPHSIKDSITIILLRSLADEHPRVSKRFDILRSILTDKGLNVIECFAEGQTRLARIFSLIALGDWVSYYLALFEGIDPSPVPVISSLKKKLGE